MPKDNGLHVESLMTAVEFKSCGLNKLSEVEIAYLDAWLTEAMMKAVKDPVSAKSATAKAHDAIESEIDGDFNGRDGETIFKID